MLPIGEKMTNTAKHRLKAGEKLIGSWAQLCSPMSAEILARAQFDFLLFDMEHAPLDEFTLMTQLMAAAQYKVPSIVRVPWNDFVTIKRVLDTGAYGIHVPYVNTAEEARQAVRAVKYPPEGIRGIAGSPRAAGYGLNTMDYWQVANDEILLYVAMETPTGVANLDEILEVEGVDGIFIGPADLSTSYGHMGNAGHPEVQAVMREIESKTLAAGKFLGTIAGDFEAASKLYDLGYQLVVAMADGAALSKASSALVKQFRDKYGK